jgi:hypothetical protein
MSGRVSAEDAGDASALMCPSSRCEPGASLIAILDEGRLAHITPALPVNEAFVASAREHGSPEARMRFASPCLKAGCAQWTGSSCGIIEQVVAAEIGPSGGRLPRCAIRPSCRWYAQEGAAACRACPLVVTDAREAPARTAVDGVRSL